MLRKKHKIALQWGTYRTNIPGGAVTQLVPRAVSVPLPCYAALINYF